MDRTGPEGDDPGARLVSAIKVASSAALNVLFDGHTAVPEERAGQRLQQRPGVGAGVKGLHVAQGRTLAAHDAPRGVDFTVQDHGAAETRGCARHRGHSGYRQTLLKEAEGHENS